MPVFVDTSAVFAFLDADDQNHQPARAQWATLAEHREILVTTNYVLVETMALLARRLGIAAVRVLQADVVPVLHIHWVDRVVHEQAVSAMLTVGSRHLSLVDCVSFEVMRRVGLDTAFAFDRHFVEQGIRCIP